MAVVNLESTTRWSNEQQLYDARPAVSTLREMGLNAEIVNPAGDTTVLSTDIDERFNILSKCNAGVRVAAIRAPPAG